MAYDKVDYVLPGVGMVEVFSDREAATAEQMDRIKRRLSLKPAVISNLHLLLDHPVTVKVHGIHKSITVPALPAFYIHRLITAVSGEYRDPVLHPHKIRKDYKQAALVAKKILNHNDLRKQTAARILKLPPHLRQQFDKGAQVSRKHVKAPDLTEADSQYIRKLAALDAGA